jgi:hypothetical protein
MAAGRSPELTATGRLVYPMFTRVLPLNEAPPRGPRGLAYSTGWRRALTLGPPRLCKESSGLWKCET